MYILSQKSADYLHLMPEKLAFDISKQIRSPMPGLVKAVNCNVGDMVSEGQDLCIIGKILKNDKATPPTKYKYYLIKYLRIRNT